MKQKRMNGKDKLKLLVKMEKQCIIGKKREGEADEIQ